MHRKRCEGKRHVSRRRCEGDWRVSRRRCEGDWHVSRSCRRRRRGRAGEAACRRADFFDGGRDIRFRAVSLELRAGRRLTTHFNASFEFVDAAGVLNCGRCGIHQQEHDPTERANLHSALYIFASHHSDGSSCMPNLPALSCSPARGSCVHMTPFKITQRC